MNKKTLDELTETSNFNSSLLQTCMQLTKQFQQLPTREASQYYQQYPSIKQKQQTLQKSIISKVKIMSQLFDLKKFSTNRITTNSVEIFENIVDSIDSNVQKIQNKGYIRKAPVKNINQSRRPQDVYSHIRPFQFNIHQHEKNLKNIRIDTEIIKSRSIQEQYQYIETEQQFLNMIQQLKNQRQIAVDLEHSNKSYEGMTCLIQISSRSRDYIVDVFPIWNILPKFNEIMSNPAIIKVMHGADMDVKWLQRDFNVHISNLFDTHKASRVMGFAKFSLGYLLEYYCNVNMDKKTYQLADWRMRPLPSDMLNYARCDTHYLLQIWDRLRKDLALKAEKLALEPVQVITGIYEVSYQVTRLEAQLFNYHKMDIYQNLSDEMKKKDFDIIENIFKILNEVAKQHDEAFFDLIPKRLLIESLAIVKDIIYNKYPPSKDTRIDKILSILKKSNSQFISEILPKIKDLLSDYFKKKKLSNQVNTDKQQCLTNYPLKNQKSIEIKSNAMDIQHNKFIREKVVHPIVELSGHLTFEKQQKVQINFAPIMVFVANKYGVQPIQDQDQIDGDNVQADQYDVKQEQEALEEVQQNNQIIQFGNFKNNVKYVIQQDFEGKIPKKKRKQAQYEKNIQNKNANIYDFFS